RTWRTTRLPSPSPASSSPASPSASGGRGERFNARQPCLAARRGLADSLPHVVSDLADADAGRRHRQGMVSRATWVCQARRIALSALALRGAAVVVLPGRLGLRCFPPASLLPGGARPPADPLVFADGRGGYAHGPRRATPGLRRIRRAGKSRRL